MEKYKACRALEEHTGGGDGDESDNVEEGSDTENSSKQFFNLRCFILTSSLEKIEHQVRVAGKFSRNVLDAFRQSEIYTLIDEV